MTDPIYVTKPYLPPLEEFTPYLERIWDSKILTNNGPFHKQLEQALCDYLEVEHLELFANGTIALITAIRALDITGEVITTPYSFVATAHSLLWNNIIPVFVDIDPKTCNLDPNRIEEAITPQTTAILPVHCYGNPCDVEAIEKIATAHNIKVLYDAASAFGVNYKGESLLKHGELSVISFHATKVFTTFEGGAIVCPNVKSKQNINSLKNFGFVDEVTVIASGINGKMSEISAAFGLLQLKHINSPLARRRRIETHYQEALADVQGVSLLPLSPETEGNAGYFPIFVGEDYPLSRDELYQKMKDNNIHCRRYFYPLLSDMPMYNRLPSARADNLPFAKKIAEQVVCLPIYPELQIEEQEKVIQIIRDSAQ